MELEYNTSLDSIIIREYGRNVQRMVDHVMTIEDRDLRTRAAKDVIKVMAQINPDPKKSNDYDQKLWDHLYMMSNYELEVDAPYEVPKPLAEAKKETSKPDYPKGGIRYRHYGRIVQDLIKVAREESDPEKKERMKAFIASYMKLAYKMWNEQKLSDDVIMKNLIDLSDGELSVEEIVDIAEGIDHPSKAQMSQFNQQQRKKKKKTIKRKRKR